MTMVVESPSRIYAGPWTTNTRDDSADHVRVDAQRLVVWHGSLLPNVVQVRSLAAQRDDAPDNALFPKRGHGCANPPRPKGMERGLRHDSGQCPRRSVDIELKVC